MVYTNPETDLAQLDSGWVASGVNPFRGSGVLDTNLPEDLSLVAVARAAGGLGSSNSACNNFTVAGPSSEASCI
jgi:hypothetical protein